MRKLLLLAVGCSSLNAQMFTIDDFEAAPFSLTGSSTTFESYAGAEENILGGVRQVRMAQQDFTLPNVITTVADGILTFNETDPSALVLRYGSFADANDSTALNLDLTGQNYEFTLEVTSMTTPFRGAVDFYSYDAGGTAHYYDSIAFTILEPGTHSYSLSEVRNAGIVDFSNIAGMEIIFATGPGGDTGLYQFGNMELTPIPEPSTYAAIFALGLLGFIGWRRFTSRPTQY